MIVRSTEGLLLFQGRLPTQQEVGVAGLWGEAQLRHFPEMGISLADMEIPAGFSWCPLENLAGSGLAPHEISVILFLDAVSNFEWNGEPMPVWYVPPDPRE